MVPGNGLPHLHFLGQWTGLLEITFLPSRYFRRSRLSPSLVCNPRCLSEVAVRGNLGPENSSLQAYGQLATREKREDTLR